VASWLARVSVPANRAASAAGREPTPAQLAFGGSSRVYAVRAG